jgi:hypothetical protein
MCLNNSKGPYKARKDIIVYKVFEICSSSLLVLNYTQYRSPFKYTRWPKEGLSSTLSAYGESVEDGLHSFVDKKGAYNLKRYRYGQPTVKMCVIPAGSTYYRGTFKKYRSIASNRLIIKEFYKPKKK